MYILVVKTFRGDKIKITMCAIVGWGLPGLVVAVWATAKAVMIFMNVNDQVSLNYNNSIN